MMRRILLLCLSIVLTTTLVNAQEDVSLEQVVALALEKNYDIRIAEKAAESATLDDDYAYNAFLPRVNATGALVWNKNDQEVQTRSQTTGEIQTRKGPTASNNLSGSVQLVWTLFDGLRMFATRERIEMIAEQGELVVKDQMVNTIASVTTNYYDIVRQKQQLKAIQEQMSVSQERVKLAELKFEVGTGAKPELLQARVDYNEQRTQALQQESLIEQLKKQLNALVGMQLPTPYDVSDTIIIELNLQREDILNEIERTNYNLQVSRRNVDVASFAIRERKAEFLPFLDFNAAYTYSETENTKVQSPFSPLFNLNTGFNYGLTLNIPIFNGMNQRRLAQQSKITLNQQELLYEQQKVNVNVSAENAFTNYDNARKILLVEEENILLAKENVNIALAVFKRGASTFVELRTAQQSLADAYTRLITARYMAKAAEIELLRLNGSLLR
ncbi:MAG TPA: TolC family protein [Ohtaekwangia sp.]|nr:TolC family protein [Ohtaekwangia sp.]